MKMWRLFKTSKTPNYDHLCRAIKGEMIRWANRQLCWIEEGVYFDNKSLNEWIALKFNPGDSTALYSSADNGISILKCRAPTSAHLEDLRRQEEIWDATKGNATYVEVVKLSILDLSLTTLNLRRISLSTGSTCNSRHLRWKVTSCQPNMASKFKDTTSHRNGGRRNLSTAPQSPTTWARAAEGATNLYYRQQHLLLARINHLRPKPPSLTTGALQIGLTNATLR